VLVDHDLEPQLVRRTPQVEIHVIQIRPLSGASAKSTVEYGASAEEVPHGVTYWPYDG
jgi:hypothetical protein